MPKKCLQVICLIGILFFCSTCVDEQNTQATDSPEESINPTNNNKEQEPIETVPPAFTATLEPTNTMVPTPTMRSILWQDDFSDVSSGWERYREFDGVLDYVEEEAHYQMQISAVDTLWWVWLENELPDVTISVEAWQASGPEGSLYGLMCRHDPDTRQGVVFLINSLGQAGVGLMKNGFEAFPNGELTDFDAIQTGLNARNTIEVICKGNMLTMTVNGINLFEISYGDVLGEAVGLAVATPSGSGPDVRFDNFVIYSP